MFERFTEDARRTVVLAQEEARLACYRSIGPEQILVALAHDEALVDLLPPVETLRTSLEAIDQEALNQLGIPIAPEGDGRARGPTPWSHSLHRTGEGSPGGSSALSH